VDPIEDREPRGKVDAASLLFIVGGIPAIWVFIILVVLVGPRFCHLPA
jgi:hypothetical protein